ncbi:hypothetical protein [Sulfurimonas sp.]|uniref:hypothetical protein n=1 Tax=Sulfurimonas sp. TaxID=2022749 RepID=UPI00261DE662|nr:hypothetical protein [Sulfurimonas sp.]MDD5157917.1 hypothetical protein [Sulfurimonas sp.]
MQELETVEELEEELEAILAKIDSIEALVYEQKMDAYEGFVESDKYKDRVIELGYKLKALGIDITTREQ